jgi:predicted enzyme related to lactoylglutathione lyase
MITGVHALIYSPKVEQVRAFLRDVLGWPSVDAGGGWPIFAMPPSEIAVHPTENDADDVRQELFLMCDDLDATAAELAKRGVGLASEIATQPWGRATSIRLPGGGELGLYQPRHPTALALSRDR